MNLISAAARLSILLGLLTPLAAAADAGQTESWQRAEALAAARSVDTAAAVERIFHSAPLNNAAEVLRQLRVLETRADWPVPAREAALYHFTRQLADLRRTDVAAAVMQHLRAYQGRTLVPREDHAEAVEPLYNLSSAAAGVENTWLRREAAEAAGRLLQTEPAALVDAFVSGGAGAPRAGYLEALGQADPTALEAIQSSAQARLAAAPELTPLLAAAVGITADAGALRRLLIDGRGAGLAAALGRVTARLPAAQLSALLRLAVERAPAVNAALAIAQWWPTLRHEQAARRLLLDHLQDSELGEAAALALARAPDVATIRALQALAAGDSLTASRARLALDVSRSLPTGEAPR